MSRPCGTIGQRTRDLKRPAWTLAEAVVSTGVMSILMLGLGSTIIVASKAVPTRDDPAARASDTAIALQEMAADLTAATGFTAYTSRAVTFTVADRDNDGSPETISYAWSGSPGDPLTRRVNGGRTVVVAPSLNSFSLGYDTHSWTETFDPVDTESSETLLAAYTTPRSAVSYSITSSSFVGQYLPVSMPVDAVSWRITRARLQMRYRGTQSGVAAVQIRPAAADGRPQATVLDQQLVSESALPAGFTWQTISFSKSTSLSPGAAVCLTIVMNVDDTYAGEVLYDTGGGSNLVATSNGESGWVLFSARSLVYELYGTVTTRNTPAPVTHNHVLRVHVALQSTDDVGRPLRTSASIMNTPEVW